MQVLRAKAHILMRGCFDVEFAIVPLQVLGEQISMYIVLSLLSREKMFTV